MPLELSANPNMGRPVSTFYQFAGQRRVVGYVRRLIDGAKKAGDVTDLLN